MADLKFPADVVAHWSTGPVPACHNHAAGLVGLGRFMGLHVAVTALTEPAECENCVNEAKARGDTPAGVPGLHPCGHMKGSCQQCHQCLRDQGATSCPTCEPAAGVALDRGG
jgi:hypothetical protein